MEKEYQILSYLQGCEDTSQRQIAGGTGLSLGTVNLLLKRMIRKGLVKIERLNARSLRYILTPKGMAEKTRLTYSYIRHSYAYIVKVSRAVERVALAARERGGNTLYLYGPRNEVLEIAESALRDGKFDYTYAADNGALPPAGENHLVIVWDLEDEEELGGDYEVVNILKVV